MKKDKGKKRMNRNLILYKSKYGASRQYAQWIAKLADGDIFEAEALGKIDTARYDCVIFSGGIYAGGLAGARLLKKNREKLLNKRLIIFAVGASPEDKEQSVQMKARLSGILERDIEFFYGRGAYDEAKMTLKDRTLCRMLRKSVEKKPEASLEPWERGLLEAKDTGCVWIDRKYIRELIENLGYGDNLK